MSLVVLKFGGAALSTPEAFSFVASIVKAKRASFEKVVCVVSAMGKTTDELTALAFQVTPTPQKRELDMLISAGERMSVALMAMALDRAGLPAKSFTGSQSGIITTTTHSDALIIDVRPFRILETLQQGEVAIVAGFQGVSLTKEITTLGRGGSDTTAVALGVALGASHVEFYKDVDGFFDKDPKVFQDAVLHEELSYEVAYTLATGGAKILHSRAISLASKNKLPLHVKPLWPSTSAVFGTAIGSSKREVAEPVYEVEGECERNERKQQHYSVTA